MPAGSYRPFDDDPLMPRLAGALFISILIHTSLFAVVQIGNQLNWWEAKPFSMFRKVRITPEELAKVQEQARLQAQKEIEQAPTIYVQVTDPSEDPPLNTPYYSSQSSRAANPEPASGTQPKIDGNQTQSPRVESAPRMMTARAASTPPPEPVQSRESRPEPLKVSPPQPENVAKPIEPQIAEKPPEPERAPGIGDLAMARPEVKPAAPPVTPAPTPPNPNNSPTLNRQANDPSVTTPPPKARPRTVTEARLRQDLLAGEKMKQDGGVTRKGKMALDVKGTGFGAYDEALILAVQNRWFSLLDERRFAGGVTGKVVVKFKLHADGSVRIVEPTESTVDALMTSLCVRAVRDPSPYEKWPSEMLRLIGSNSREVKFTFFYN
ncbi:MAG: hypothetical protein IT581_08270 [Verrucomicrobiales bacterium]|nr:hypothetical protein [Verrucomicrobiales bacterium]